MRQSVPSDLFKRIRSNFVRTIPIMAGYLVLGIGFGIPAMVVIGAALLILRKIRSNSKESREGSR